MKYFVEIRDQFGNTEQKLLTKKQWEKLVDNNPELEVRIIYYISGSTVYAR